MKNTKENQELAQLSPFELKDRVIKLADKKIKKEANTMLNAGRGNPNWVSTEARDAFFALGQFAMKECRDSFYLPEGIAGVPQQQGIASRFELWLKEHKGEPGIDFLSQAYVYCLMELNADPDALIDEWAGGISGHDYPSPDRILYYTQIINRKYLDWALCDNHKPEGVVFDLFATEGSTAGMVYCFNVLKENFLLNEGDSIALMVPVFTPYIEIPQLSEFKYDVLNISANQMDNDGLHTWQYNPKDIAKLADHKYKMLFIVNPSNPPSYAMDESTMQAIKDAVAKNPDLMILTDDVYGTFVNDFRSIIADLPYNTMSCYSFSKYFGATGWRIAFTAVAQENVYDTLLSRLPEDKKEALRKRYSSLSTDPDKIKFIDRMVAESRLVALNHTAGLSTPQQVQMSLFALGCLLPQGDAYHKRMIKMIHDRYNALWKSFGFEMPANPLRADYYSEIDLLVWAKKLHGQEFVDYMKKNYDPLSAMFRLATETGSVVLNGDGFDGPRWSIRVSLANLNEEDYMKLGANIRQVLDQYATEWQASKSQK